MGRISRRKQALRNVGKVRLAKLQKLKEQKENAIPPETSQFDTIPNLQEKEIEIEVLQTEKEQRPSNAEEYSLTGTRIVDLGFIIEQIAAIANHGKVDCQWKHMTLLKETRHGMSTSLHFKCKMCGLYAILETNRDTQETDDRLVLGCQVAGIGFSKLEDICGALNMPMISRAKYAQAQKRVTKKVNMATSNSMEKAGEIRGRTIYHELELDGKYTKKYIELRSKGASRQKKPIEQKCSRVATDCDYGLVKVEEEEITIKYEPLM